MRIKVLIFALLSIVPSLLFAAVRYEFRQTVRSDSQSGAVESAGRAVIADTMSRVDYSRSPVYPPGAYVISSHGSRTFYVIDPGKKIYSEVVPPSISGLLAGKVTISNLKTDVRKLDDHPLIAGYPTDHYRFEATYDMTVQLGSLPLKQRVQTTIDKWVTPLFAEAQQVVAENLPRTGDPKLDELVAAEMTRIQGFPLRQVITISTQREKPRGGNAEMPYTRQQVNEIEVTSIEKAEVEPDYFRVPTGFTKADLSASEGDQGRIHMLDMKTAPEGGQE